MSGDERARLSRRALLGTTGITALGLALLSEADAARAEPDAAGADAALDTALAESRGVRATGSHQAGIARPRDVQPHLMLTVHDLAGPGVAGNDLVAAARTTLASLGSTIVDLTGGDRALAGIDPGDLTITVGVGPRLVAAVDASLPGATPLPAFPREELDERHRDGDVVIQVCASDPLLLPLVQAHLGARLPQLRERWRQRGVRGPAETVNGDRTAPRNVLGFIDGIVVPVTKAEHAASVWIDDGPAAGGTIMVVRRMEIDLPSFHALSVKEQEATIGRRRATGAPLSGGGIADDVNLQAKTADGRYRIAADAHSRRAHPRPTGVPLMLRRSYSTEDPLGLLFISMQTELSTFTRTLERMNESDALLAFTRTTASGTFLLLPGFTRDRPLGATIFGAA